MFCPVSVVSAKSFTSVTCAKNGQVTLNTANNKPIGHFRVTLYLCFKMSPRAMKEPVGETRFHFHMNGFTRRLVLIQRHVAEKWPISTYSNSQMAWLRA